MDVRRRAIARLARRLIEQRAGGVAATVASEFAGLAYKKLQALAKKKKIKANQKREELIEALEAAR